MALAPDFKELLDSITNKRARFVIDTILEKGYCSTEDIEDAGYKHAPRAPRDVREAGIPLETFRVRDRDGKSIAAYRFGNWEEAKQQNQLAKTGGRTQLSSKLKNALLERYGSYCHLYREAYPERLLQPDHRIPYEIGGDPEDMLDTDCFMLLSPSANRDKSWACEHCSNWTRKDPNMCKTCYYAFPEHYEHIAGEAERRIPLVFRDAELPFFDSISEMAQKEDISLPELIKKIIKKL